MNQVIVDNGQLGGQCSEFRTQNSACDHQHRYVIQSMIEHDGGNNLDLKDNSGVLNIEPPV